MSWTTLAEFIHLHGRTESGRLEMRKRITIQTSQNVLLCIILDLATVDFVLPINLLLKCKFLQLETFKQYHRFWVYFFKLRCGVGMPISLSVIQSWLFQLLKSTRFVWHWRCVHWGSVVGQCSSFFISSRWQKWIIFLFRVVFLCIEIIIVKKCIYM